MLIKDQKGYALSAIGILLMIPIILIIPVALNVQDQASTSADVFTQTDTVFRAVNNIATDIDNRLYEETNKFTDEGPTVEIREDRPKLISDYLKDVITITHTDTYLDSYAYILDSLEIEPAYNDTGINMNNTTGYARTKHGLIFEYDVIEDDQGNIFYTEGNRIYYDYAVSVNINLNIEGKKDSAINKQSGYKQNLDTTTGFTLKINTRARDGDEAEAAQKIDIFFTNLKNNLRTYC